ncbi:MAG: NADAR family protein [Fluviicola sp.]
MTYSLDWLNNRIKEGEKVKYLFFWGHTQKSANEIDASCLSQWYPAEFQEKGIIFRSAEHWMMYQKALLFNDSEIAQEIIQCDSPGEAKKLGRKVSSFDQKKWEAKRFEIVVKGNQLKFSQNPRLQEYLIKTKARVLVEASPVDPIWGIGRSRNAMNVENPKNWRGLNLLGFALMEARDEISQSTKNSVPL